MALTEKIVELKNKLGLSRVAFAKALDSSPSQMARIEVGTVVPDREFFVKVCDTFHVDMGYFDGRIDIDAAVTIPDKEEKKQQIGKRLKQARLEKGMTLKELSDLVGMSYSQLSLIENAVYKLTDKRAEKIGEVFGNNILHGRNNDLLIEPPVFIA